MKTTHARRPLRHSRRRAGGAAAILAMMFLMIFGSLAAAMAIVSQANLATADSHLKVNRARAASETGMQYMIYRVTSAANLVTTRAGIIDSSNAGDLWTATSTQLLADFSNELHNVSEPSLVNGVLTVGPIAVGPNDPRFTATLIQHPITGEDYGSDYYQRPPYSTMTPAVSASNPLDGTWVRVRVEAFDGPANSDGSASNTAITRSCQMDFKMDKKIRFAILSKSRVMIGRHVMIDGPIGSRFEETHLDGGHPIQMDSDFRGLDSTLDASLTALANALNTNDTDGDNRIDLTNASETQGITDPGDYDLNGDGFIDDYDYFLGTYDTNADGIVTAVEFDTASDIRRAQLLELIDTWGDPTRTGYNDGQIDDSDRYAKIQGQIMLTADFAGWNTGAADGNIQDYYRGPVHPDYGETALTFSATDADVHQFGPSDFDVSSFKTTASGDLASQAVSQAATYDPSDPDSPQPLGTTEYEAVPFGAAYPYDYYDRPVYENMTFTNVTIPKGTNALFKNCTFVGVTFVETETDNDDINFNYSGMTEADGALKHPDRITNVGGVAVTDTKTLGNNIRFDGCTFEGAIVSDPPTEFTHVRNKLAFTGTTRWNIDDSLNLNDSEKLLYKRSTILTPHFSVEMGTFINPTDATETVELSGTIVAGVIDLRGQVDVEGTILTTFEPVSDTGPVIGDTSPNFNVTLGYFGSGAGDLEAEIPAAGLGKIHLVYNEDLPLPDGILGPIEIVADWSTYFEGGAAPAVAEAEEAEAE